ncbi:hypothetical protein VNI00_017269 [Paramarasmius palmivorus]|uniref:Uncharacterized protein n=1 Tax=Paramarasmius palmivorus TaxID=297713 RepID=A0AAW0B885_9AGAR
MMLLFFRDEGAVNYLYRTYAGNQKQPKADSQPTVSTSEGQYTVPQRPTRKSRSAVITRLVTVEIWDRKPVEHALVTNGSVSQPEAAAESFNRDEERKEGNPQEDGSDEGGVDGGDSDEEEDEDVEIIMDPAPTVY